jgi:Tfp pilus assembly protein PilX
MLIATLALIGLVAILGTVLLSMTFTATRSSSEFSDSGAAISQADAAMESVLSRLRRDVDAAGVDCYDSTTVGSHASSYVFPQGATAGQPGAVVVECDTVTPIGDARDITLRAYAGSPEELTGAARVLIVDRVGAEERPGLEVVVCDWQLGAALTSSPAACS